MGGSTGRRGKQRQLARLAQLSRQERSASWAAAWPGQGAGSAGPGPPLLSELLYGPVANYQEDMDGQPEINVVFSSRILELSTSPGTMLSSLLIYTQSIPREMKSEFQSVWFCCFPIKFKL